MHIDRYRIQPCRNHTYIDAGYNLIGTIHTKIQNTALQEPYIYRYRIQPYRNRPYIHRYRIQSYKNHLYKDTGYNRIGTIYTSIHDTTVSEPFIQRYMIQPYRNYLYIDT